MRMTPMLSPEAGRKSVESTRYAGALFLDFDNVYLGISHVDLAMAEAFARHPERWLQGLTDGLTGETDGWVRRDLLVRRCYLNPGSFGRYRLPFVRAGFEVVDCPVLTGFGKTATDAHMTVDMMEALHHQTRFDEFIVLSADADFTPVLSKLRLYDRRTVVVAAQKPSAAYSALADRLFGPEEFLALLAPHKPAEQVTNDAA